jgi:hypothetical protein
MAEHDDTDLRTGAKAAAAAAAVGAAVGVARAIAARAEEAAHRDDHDDHGDDGDEREDEPVVAQQRTEPDEDDELEHVDDEPEPERQARRRPVQGTGVDRLRRLTDNARELLHELSGAEVEAVSAIDRTRDGWRVTLETVEVRRIPDSMDVMATYDVELDGDGDLVRYERRRRYARAQSDHGDRG